MTYKSIFLCTFLFLFSHNLLAQQTWQEATETADSLSLKFKNKDALPYRVKALKLDDIQDKNITFFLQTLHDITLAETQFSSPDVYTETYNKVKTGIIKLDSIGAKPDRLYQAYRKLYIYSHNYMRDMEATEKYIKKSIAFHFKSKKIDSLTLLKTMHSSGVISRELGKLNYAVNVFKEGAEFYQSMTTKDTNTLGAIYTDLAYTYHNKFLNIPQKRLEYLVKSQKVFESIAEPNMDYLSSLYTRLSDVEIENGNYNNAIGYLKKGFDLYINNKEKTQESRMGTLGVKKEMQYYHFIVQLQSYLDNEDKMLDAFKKIKKISKTTKLDATEYEFLSLSYLFIGKYYQTKQPNHAIDYLNNGLKIAKKATEINLLPEFNLEIAKHYIQEKNYSLAEKIIIALQDSNNKIASIEKEYFKVAALLYLEKKQKNKALNYINKLLNSIDNGENNLTYNQLNKENYNPGYVLDDAKLILEIAQAIETSSISELKNTNQLYWVSLKHFEQNFKNEHLNSKLNNIYTSISKKLMDVAARDKFTTTQNNYFIATTEYIESKFLYNKLLQNRSIKGKNALTKLISSEQQIRSNITFLRKKFSSKKEEAITQQIFEEELKLKEIETKMIESNKLLSNYLHPKFSIEDLKLQENTTIIKFKKAQDSLYRMVITLNETAYNNLGAYKAIEKEISSFLTEIKNPSSPLKSIKNKGENLYSYLFSNIALTEKTYIIPDVALHYLPMELLQYRGNYLLNKTNISYTFGLSYLDTSIINKTNSNDLVACFAPSYKKYIPSQKEIAVRGEPYDLSGAKEEVKSISKNIKSIIFEGNNATKKNFRKLEADVSVLHLSMHSYLNDEDPELSSLVFSDSSKDFELYISELYGLNFNANLAVLSACNTGVGGFKDGKGIVSMSHAFTFAGIPSTVSSLWSAPDLSTKQIMVSFYKNLKNGETKSLALKNAKLNYLNTTNDINLQHPYYWAGFILHGNDTPLKLQSNSFPLWIWIAISIVLLSAIAWFLSKKKS